MAMIDSPKYKEPGYQQFINYGLQQKIDNLLEKK